MTDLPPMPGSPHGKITTNQVTQPRNGQYTLMYNSYQISYNQSGVVLMDTSTASTATGQIVAVQYNPQGYEGGIYDSTTSVALVMIAAPFTLGATLN